MEINKELIQHIAKVARLNLDTKEIETFKNDFKEILKAFSKINEVDTNNTKSSFQPVNIQPHLREDIPQKCLTQEQALSLTDHKKDGYFKGPKVI